MIGSVASMSKARTLQLMDEDIYEYAGHISAVEDVLFFMETHDWFDEDEAEYLLGLDDTLEALANAWEEAQLDINFRTAMDSLLGPAGTDGEFDDEDDGRPEFDE